MVRVFERYADDKERKFNFRPADLRLAITVKQPSTIETLPVSALETSTNYHISRNYIILYGHIIIIKTQQLQ